MGPPPREGRRSGGDRGRLTVPDVLFLLMGIAFLGALYPVFWGFYTDNLTYLSPGAKYLFQLMLPLLLLVIYTIVFRNAVGGG